MLRSGSGIVPVMHVHAVDIHISQVIIGFAASKEILFTLLHPFEYRIGEACVSRPPVDSET